MMERYAGFLSHTDQQIGRFIQFLEEVGKLENTPIFLCSDNGASAHGMLNGVFNELSTFNRDPKTVEENLNKIDELGGPSSYNHYPAGWAMAGDTPFKWYQQSTHYGGTKDPLRSITSHFFSFELDLYQQIDQSVKVCPYTSKFECIDCHKKQHSNDGEKD
jgi:arylsulfatase A-like enzyme